MFEANQPRQELMGKSYSMTFFGKVLLFFGLAVLMSVLGMVFTITYLFQFIAANPGIMYVMFIAELVIIFTARYWKAVSPLNKIMFALFAFITGMTAAPLVAITAATAGTMLVVKALIATVLTFGAAGIFGWTTKMDISGLRGFLGMSLIGMILVGLVGIFIPWSNTMELIYSWFGVIIFSGYVMYDFQRIKRFPEDMYIDAALALYLDIFNIFLFILRIMYGSRR